MAATIPKPTAPAPQAPRDWTWLGFPALALLMAASVILVRQTDSTKPADWNESRLTYLPSGKLIKPLVMDLDEAAADILWIDGMMYFADAYLEKKSYRWMGHILDIVTILNPHFHPAYEFGGVVLTKEKGQLPGTLRLLDRGIAEFPKDWRLHLYAAMAQLTLDSNFSQAAEYLKPVTLEPDVPDHIRTLSASLMSKGGGRRMALAFLVDCYIKTDNAINREIFVEKILKLYPGKPEQEAIRKDAVTRVLHEVSIEPQGEMIGLGVLHEYLSDSLTPQSKRLMDMLFR